MERRPVIDRVVVIALTGSIKLYQSTFSVLIPSSCRFFPSCSQYAIDAMQEHGALVGLWMAVKRVCRCHPYHPGGHDPVRRKRGIEEIHG